MSIQDLTASLDLKQNLNIYATCKQFDDLNLILSIYDRSMSVDLTNYNVRLKAMKADQVPLIQEHVGITVNGNITTIEADEQLTTTAGKTPIELQFINKSTGKKKATFNLVLIVVASTLEVNATISTATYTLLEELENKLDQASDFLENIDEAVQANSTLETTITNSETAKGNLESTISTGNTLKTGLETDFSTGNILKEDLETTIINADNSKTALDTSKTNADALKVALDASIAESEQFVAEHSDVNNLITTVASHSTQLSEKANNYGVFYGLTISAQNTPNMTVKASSGVIYMLNGTRYVPTTNGSIPITTSDSTNPRIDIIYVNSSGIISYLVGTPSASPIAPTLPTDGLLLAQIVVPANATSIISANITDKRVMHSSLNKKIDEAIYAILQNVKSYGGSINLVGDSITYGHLAYGPLFSDMLRDKVNALFGTNVIPVKNLGVSGYATADFLTVTKKNDVINAMTGKRNNIFIIGLAVNDIYSSSSAVSSQQFKINLTKLIKYYRNCNKNFVILTVPIICNVAEILEPFANYKDVVYDLASEYNLPVIDYSTLDISGFLSDNIHPSTGGHVLMYNKIIETLANKEIRNILKTNAPSYVKNYWNMNYPTSFEFDVVGGKNGVVAGTTIVDGTFSNARKFDGSANKINISNLTLPVNFTLLFNVVDIGSQNGHLFSSFNGTSSCGFSLTRFSGKLYLYSQSVYNASPPNVVELGTFGTDIINGSKLALVINNNSAKLYINGILKTTIAAILPILDRGKLCVGYGGQEDTINEGYFFNGALDEVAICDVLTDAQILAVAQSTNALIY